MTRLSDLIDSVPAYVPNAQTSEDAASNLRHTLAVYDSPEGGGPVADGDFVIVASHGYAMTRTGLTWGDLKLINEALSRLEGLDK